VNVGKLLLRSTAIAARHNLQVPRELMLLFKAIVSIEALGKRLEPEFDILQVGYRQARQVLTLRYSKERMLKDLVVIGRDLQLLVERVPRIGKRFLRHWAQNGFSFETRSPDTARLAKAFRQFTYHLVACVLSLSLTTLGVVTLILDRGPWIFGVPLWSFVAFLGAFGVLGNGLWVLRKARR
jgi:ubiquinone biosynthesis protein